MKKQTLCVNRDLEAEEEPLLKLGMHRDLIFPPIQEKKEFKRKNWK